MTYSGFFDGLLFGSLSVIGGASLMGAVYLFSRVVLFFRKQPKVPEGIGLSAETQEALEKYKKVRDRMSSSGHYGDDDANDFTVESVMSGLETEDIHTPGVGDDSPPDSWGAYRVSVALNTAHRYLPGDFVKRDAEGEMILMARTDYLRLIQRMKEAW